MGVYTRFKKSPDGLRQLVELLEVTPPSRRQKMIDVGMAEDPDYTQKALSFMMTFEDVLKLGDLELAEVIAGAPGKVTGTAIHAQAQDIKDRFLNKAQPRTAAEMKETFEMPAITPVQMAGAQMKLVEVMRKLEKRGAVKVKRVPS